MHQNHTPKTHIGWNPAAAWTAATLVVALLGGCAGAATPTAIPTAVPSSTGTATVVPSVTPTATETLTPLPSDTPTITPTPSEVTQLTWFIGIGTGTAASQVRIEKAVAADFNASQGFIHLNVEVVPYESATKKLTDEISAGNGPDIVGPAGFTALNAFHGQWLDLTPYLTAADTARYNPALVKLYQTDEGQIALPFVVYPSALYYNKKLFDAAKLKYPPAHYGDQYEMPDGTQLEWNWDTLAKVARLLTLDAKGLNASQDGFDTTTIKQYGYSWTFETHPNYWGSFWGGGSMLAADGQSAQIPEAWKAAWEWTYNGIWGPQPYMATHDVESGTAFGEGNSFNSGRIGMTVQPSWYTCCIAYLKTWDVAAMPAYNGQVGGRTDADTLLILKSGKHPHEAYIALSYLMQKGVDKLITGSLTQPAAYGGMSARTGDQQAWIDAQRANFHWEINWDIFAAGLSHPDVPAAEGYVPNFTQAWKDGQDFGDRLMSDKNFDLQPAEQDYLKSLNQLFSK